MLIDYNCFNHLKIDRIFVEILIKVHFLKVADIEIFPKLKEYCYYRFYRYNMNLCDGLNR